MKKILGLVLVFLFLVSSVSIAAEKKVEPVSVSDSAGFLTKLDVNGYLRIRYSAYQANTSPDTLNLSRARIRVTGNVAPDFSFLVQPDFAGLSSGGTVALADAYGQYKCPVTGIVVRAGQFLLPFAYDSGKYKTIYGTGLNPSHYGVIMPARDYGLRAMGAVPNLAGLNYDAAIVNGTGATDTNKTKDLVGRVNYKNNFIDIGLSGYYGKAGSAEAQKRDLAVDLEYKSGPFTTVAEYMLGQNTAATAKLQEASLQVSGLFGGAHEPLIRYENYDPNTAIGGNIVNTVTLGYTYSMNKNTKFIVNYNLVAEETTPTNNDTLMFELQTQI
ncbi:hypothetical protein A2276_06795 [candidate division WOR-1 bacterium RIFOXYA12_FULL_43_27]|uniref:Porin domain-containing protein n=1 Tax=candidate division WOR-1 bacterium RIFOXYC2_FULL_46_14 TaxID=1802587 RepID=A0A1F4U5V8_UNCSA|nr:MAG: hypothetical protein A2276_06795 [candidate division WOR-1 bacterium RIFOXYA12_FULL_43_27]OGC20354.1 MAG: hypothetical protein A2292_04795 [candidate division WOR-1 bacterium RIFOXYB2_FULL_46_45]OGC31909.1 MAG: hypothetical protein A2232_06655 [candidate division WOR-1 bacterium RIFOXYA2_FULL_46_56]OGC40200.1 MAG: hypothetical protein A2438_02815 [candidate division WOR-1 bacterium RIFOXYC2_FULL_46_14]